jgi:hypothetical protein
MWEKSRFAERTLPLLLMQIDAGDWKLTATNFHPPAGTFELLETLVLRVLL